MSYDWDRVGVLTSIYIRWYQNENSMCDLSGQRCHLISGLQKCLAEKKCAESPHWWEYVCLCLMHHSHHVLEKNQYPGVICRFCLIKNPEKHRIRTNTGAKSPQLTHTNTLIQGKWGGGGHLPLPPALLPLLSFPHSATVFPTQWKQGGLGGSVDTQENGSDRARETHSGAEPRTRAGGRVTELKRWV